MTTTPKHTQKGAVLIVSLLILLVLTIVGVSGLANTGMEERMSHNFQHSALTFQAAESAIQKVIIAGDDRRALGNDNPFFDEDEDPFRAAEEAGEDATTTVITYDMDPDNHLGSANLSVTSTVIYRGPVICQGGFTIGTMTCKEIDIDTTASITATGAVARHVQTVSRVAPL